MNHYKLLFATLLLLFPLESFGFLNCKVYSTGPANAPDRSFEMHCDWGGNGNTIEIGLGPLSNLVSNPDVGISQSELNDIVDEFLDDLLSECNRRVGVAKQQCYRNSETTAKSAPQVRECEMRVAALGALNFSVGVKEVDFSFEPGPLAEAIFMCEVTFETIRNSMLDDCDSDHTTDLGSCRRTFG